MTAADKYGAEEIPALQSSALVHAKKGQHAADKALDTIGSYLQAALESRLGAAWSVVAPNEHVVAEVFTRHPKDILINPAQLPGLFLWRGAFTSERVGDDYLVTRTQVGLMWLLWWDSELKRERCLPFQSIVAKACHELLAKGRHPAWIVPGDATEGVSYRGSVLLKQAGLFEPIDRMTGSEVDVSLDPAKTGTPVQYKALQLTIPIAERMFRDPAGWASATSTTDPQNATPPDHPHPAALEMLLTQGGHELEQLNPKPTP